MLNKEEIKKEVLYFSKEKPNNRLEIELNDLSDYVNRKLEQQNKKFQNALKKLEEDMYDLVDGDEKRNQVQMIFNKIKKEIK